MMGLIDFWFSRMTFGSRGTYGAKPLYTKDWSVKGGGILGHAAE